MNSQMEAEFSSLIVQLRGPLDNLGLASILQCRRLFVICAKTYIKKVSCGIHCQGEGSSVNQAFFALYFSCKKAKLLCNVNHGTAPESGVFSTCLALH